MDAPVNTSYTYWIGIRVERDTLEFALVFTNGDLCEQVRVNNERRSLLLLLRHWNKRHHMEPARAMFCLEDKRPWSGAALHLVVDRMWTACVIDPERLHQDLSAESAGPMDAHALVRYALRFPERTELFRAPRLHEDKLKHLRERREQLLSIRGDFSTRLLEQNHHLEEELQREFERMDRRHMQLIDKLVARLDALIHLKLQDQQ